MSLLKSPDQLNLNFYVKGLIYGQAGAGKTTMSVSAPNPVVIDTDNGLYRVEKRFQVPSLQVSKYQEILDLLNTDEIKPFESIVIDTFGNLIEMMEAHILATNPKAKQGDGSLSMKGWGYLKNEFNDFVKKVKFLKKHLIFVAHAVEAKDGDVNIYRINAKGSSKNDLLGLLDFVGFIEIVNDKRTISFAPSQRFYAKNALKLESRIEIPNTDTHPNDFIQRVIIDGTKKRQEADEEINAKYQNVLDEWNKKISDIETPDDANSILTGHKEVDPIWDSAIKIKRTLWEATQNKGFEFDKEKMAFVLPVETSDSSSVLAAG